MLNISFISAGSTSSQTPVMATLGYEIVKNWIKSNKTLPDFPLACIFDFSNMYSTLQFFATDKILMRMGELTSLIEEIRSNLSSADWSKCSFPSKFVHKDTNDPLFFMIPVFPRGVTSFLSKTEALELTKNIWEISNTLQKAGTQFIFFDLPLIEARQKRFFEIAALLNSNLIFGIIDCSKVDFNELIMEIKMLEIFLRDYNILAEPPLTLSGLVFTKISEAVLSEKWLDKVIQQFSYPIIGMIREDKEFQKIIPHYQIPTIDSLFNQMKCAKDFQAAAEMALQISTNPSSLRNVKEDFQFLEKKIFNL